MTYGQDFHIEPTMKNRSLTDKIIIGLGVAVIAVIATLAVILIVINNSIVSEIEEFNRKDYEEKKAGLISELDSFINVNHHLPETLSEIGLQQNALSFDIDGAYQVFLIPDDSSDNSYIIKFSDYVNSPEYYVSKRREWVNTSKAPVTFIGNDTLKRIDEIKMWMHSDHVTTTIDSIRPNTSISFGYKVWEDDSIVFINQYKKSNGMAMKGWAVAGSRHLIRYEEFGDWEYRDKYGKTYHKFWNYRENDSLIYRPEPSPHFIRESSQ